MSDKKEKDLSPQEAGIAVLSRIIDMYKSNSVAKSNSSHELEAGEEPNNDDAECPDYLSESESSPLGEGGENKKKKKGDGSQPEHEEGMSEDEDSEHDAQEQSDDEQDSDNIEADEEGSEEEAGSEKIISDAAKDPKKKENPFAKESGESEDSGDSEKPKEKKGNPFAKGEDCGHTVMYPTLIKQEPGQEYKPELMREKGDYHENAQKSEHKEEPVKEGMGQSDEDVANHCKYCGSKKEHEHEGVQESPMSEEGSLKKPSKLGRFMDGKKEKNQKMEKMLGIQAKQKKQSLEKPKPMEEKPSGMKGY